MKPELLGPVLLVGALVVLVSVAAVRASSTLGLPSLLFYLGFGVLLGESGLGLRFDDPDLTQILGTCALVLILAEGGITTRWESVRPIAGLATVLATAGVAISVTVVTLVAHLLLDFPWQAALLAGAVVSSTDAAAVFATLRRLRLPGRLGAVLEMESGLNDAPVVLLVTLVTAGTLTTTNPAWTVSLVVYELLAGALVGVLVGFAGVAVLKRSALPSAGLYPLAVAALTVLAYGAGQVLHASGFLAVYVAALVLGNAGLPHRRAAIGFAEGLAWLAQIGLFVLLGLLVSPERLGAQLISALVLGAALLLLARPLSVFLTASWFRVDLRNQLFLSWAGLRGAVPIVLATIPYAAGLPGGRQLFDLVFVLVVVFTLIQGWTLAPVARWLKVVAPAEPTEITVESAPLEDLHADLLQVTVIPGSRLAGIYVDELQLPAGTVVSLVVRQGSGFVPAPTTRLRTGDDLLLVSTSASRREAERRLRALGRRGRLARWFGETGAERPAST